MKRFLNLISHENSEFFEAKTRFQTGGVSFENGPPFFLLPPDSSNQSQFAQPALKPVGTKPFTKHIAVYLKHTQNEKSERFLPIFGPLESEF